MYFDGINPIRVLKYDPDFFWKLYPAALTRMFFVKMTGKKLRSKIYGGGKVVHKQDIGNEILKAALRDDKPFMFGRHGSNELLIALHGMMLENGIVDKVECAKLVVACQHSGFFQNREENYIKFNHLITEASAQCDLYGTFRMIGEDYYIKHFMQKDVKLTHLNMMDFWRYEEPFTYALKGQKVLVVHYLASQILEQYEKREQLFDNPKVLPEFQLQAMPAIQTIAGNRDARFKNWFEALDYMYEQTKKYDYDVALLGCGAYGMPLAAKLKKDGKKVVYMGGVLQMLFGIYGKRWDAEPLAKKLPNEYWTTPAANFIPKNQESVEGGCYW